MNRWLLLACTTLVLFLPTLAFSQPAGLAHVDSRAPCFRWPAVDVDQDGVFDRVDHCPGTKKGCLVDTYGCSSDGDHDGVCDGLDRCPDSPSGAQVDQWGCSKGTAGPEPPPVPAPVAQSPLEAR